MMMGKQQSIGSIPPSMSQDDSDMEDDQSNDDMSSKLLAMQNLLDGLGELVGDDMKPYIEQAKQSMHMAHESAEGDQMGMDNEKEHEMDEPPKSGVDVSIGMGGKPPMPDESDDEDDGKEPKGFLAILSKRMKNK